MIKMILALIIVGTIAGCTSPKQSKPPCNVISGKNVSAHAIQTIRETEIIKIYKTGRRIDPNNSNIMHEAGKMYVISYSPTWNLRPNTPVGDPAFKNQQRPVNIHNENMKKYKDLLRNTDQAMRALGNQIGDSRAEIQKLSKKDKNPKDLQELVEKLGEDQGKIKRELAEIEK